MAYPASFHRLVIIGTIYTDVFNTTVAIVPTGGGMPAVSNDLLDDVRTVVSTWWPKTVASGGIQLSPQVKLTSIKLNRINSAGLYQDPETQEHIYASPIAGGGTYNGPPQLTIVSTLRGLDERALAGRGRMYWPLSENCQTVATDGRMTVSNATGFATGVAGLFHALDDAYLANSVGGVVGIASKTRTGAFQTLRNVSVGRVIDTMRSRRNKLAEDPSIVAYG